MSKDAIIYSKVFHTEFPNVTCDWSANGYRLPTEAEWEYAARDGKRQSASNYIGGNNAQKKAKTAVTADGIAQMDAGCSEWCWDWYSSTYYAASGNANNPHGPDYGEMQFRSGGQYGKETACRVLRGGWSSEKEASISVYSRLSLNPVEYEFLVGPEPCSFRVVRNVGN